MKTHRDGVSTPLIDASVHIFCRSNADLRSFLREPFASRGFPDYEMNWYGAPGGEYATDEKLARRASARDTKGPVSYTHLTLPTNREV